MLILLALRAAPARHETTQTHATLCIRTHVHTRTRTHTHMHTCLMKISRSRLWPNGLYLRLNLSNLWDGGEDCRAQF